MSTDILQYTEPVLRETAAPVTDNEFGSAELMERIRSLQEALHATPDGVAIAAPQIGISKRIFVVAGSAYDQALERSGETDNNAAHNDRVFINPEIVKHARKREWMEEGCLSVRPWHGSVSRYTKVTVRARDENGVLFTEGRSGLLAQIFQHEIDHLNGVLFTDKARNVEYREPDTHSDNTEQI